ncbi:MAG TPA: YggU family protein [Candidatus Poseidoniales archaeon]|nr:MAG: YggU family protein [Euryarchaeota archaeon]PXY78359.1 MAG: YggU family protein [Euryarchaeota archaeon]HHZ74488.1 YggU family protein [Candidatus Poseidoniales archaeon]HIO58139.1 YggU family protein [Candidatus Poseidoniales archaeon]
MMDINDVVTLASSGEVSIVIELQPSSSSTEISGINEWRKRLQVKVTSPALKGAANQDLINLMSDFFGLPNSSVKIDSGAKDRRKRILLSDISLELVREKLDQYLEN